VPKGRSTVSSSLVSSGLFVFVTVTVRMWTTLLACHTQHSQPVLNLTLGPSSSLSNCAATSHSKASFCSKEVPSWAWHVDWTSEQRLGSECLARLGGSCVTCLYSTNCIYGQPRKHCTTSTLNTKRRSSFISFGSGEP